jgi:hypothetical protein
MLNFLSSASKIILIIGCVFRQTFPFAQQNTFIPAEVKKLMAAYPTRILDFSNNYVVFRDSSRLLFDDGKHKTAEDLLKNPDIQDMFFYPYPKGKIQNPEKFQDAGRIRNDDFFKKMYGETAVEVQKHLVEMVWCPKLVNRKLRISAINGVDKQLAAISAELDEHPEWKDYLKSAGTFNWRTVRGGKRLSGHSFGIAIDLNTAHSNYWQWDCNCTPENVDLAYKNKIPQGIVDVFEKHGFIWGGKWYHYDTMHFEYRPELLSCNVSEAKKYFTNGDEKWSRKLKIKYYGN